MKVKYAEDGSLKHSYICVGHEALAARDLVTDLFIATRRRDFPSCRQAVKTRSTSRSIGPRTRPTHFQAVIRRTEAGKPSSDLRLESMSLLYVGRAAAEETTAAAASGSTTKRCRSAGHCSAMLHNAQLTDPITLLRPTKTVSLVRCAPQCHRLAIRPPLHPRRPGRLRETQKGMRSAVCRLRVSQLTASYLPPTPVGR